MSRQQAYTISVQKKKKQCLENVLHLVNSNMVIAVMNV